MIIRIFNFTVFITVLTIVIVITYVIIFVLTTSFAISYDIIIIDIIIVTITTIVIVIRTARVIIGCFVSLFVFVFRVTVLANDILVMCLPVKTRTDSHAVLPSTTMIQGYFRVFRAQSGASLDRFFVYMFHGVLMICGCQS